MGSQGSQRFQSNSLASQLERVTPQSHQPIKPRSAPLPAQSAQRYNPSQNAQANQRTSYMSGASPSQGLTVSVEKARELILDLSTIDIANADCSTDSYDQASDSMIRWLNHRPIQSTLEYYIRTISERLYTYNHRGLKYNGLGRLEVLSIKGELSSGAEAYYSFFKHSNCIAQRSEAEGPNKMLFYSATMHQIHKALCIHNLNISFVRLGNTLRDYFFSVERMGIKLFLGVSRDTNSSDEFDPEGTLLREHSFLNDHHRIIRGGVLIIFMTTSPHRTMRPYTKTIDGAKSALK